MWSPGARERTPGAHRLDDPGALVPAAVGEVGDLAVGLGHVVVGVAQARGHQPDQHLVVPRDRPGRPRRPPTGRVAPTATPLWSSWRGSLRSCRFALRTPKRHEQARRTERADAGGDAESGPAPQILQGPDVAVDAPVAGSQGPDDEWRPRASVATDSQPSPGRKMKNPLCRWLVMRATSMVPTTPARGHRGEEADRQGILQLISLREAVQPWRIPGFMPRLSNHRAVSPDPAPAKKMWLIPCARNTTARPSRSTSRAKSVECSVRSPKRAPPWNRITSQTS